jgi:signal transduction histidine kinase
VWIATDEGVSRVSAGSVSNLRVRDGLVYFSTRALMEDREGNLWIGTDQGLSCWRDGEFVQNAATRALAQEKIWTILQDGSGVIWFGTRDHGLFRYSAGEMAQFTTAQSLASNSIYQLLEDRHGQLWMSSPNTISSIPLEALDRATPGGELHLAVTSYEMPYDADGAQMYGGRQPSGCVDRDGRVWFPSSKGAVSILPEPGAQAGSPKLLLTGVAVDGREVAVSTLRALSADASRVEISFAPLSIRSQGETRFRYRLEPFDRDWTYSGRNRVATYTNLPAGKYKFRVMAFPLSDPSASAEASFEFRKPPHFYMTWWFISLNVALVGLLSLVAYRWRVRLLQMRFKAVLEERGRLAREMHDTVIQGCTSVSALLEAISSLERENDALHEELLDFARAQMRTTINEARQAVWNLRHGDEPQQEISGAVATISEHTSREFGVAVTSSSTGSPFPVPNSMGHEMLMVIREAVYNAVLHGKAAHIGIEFSYGSEGVEVRVRDDGSGFDPGAVPSDGQAHYGMTGMQERVQRLSGRIEWISARGQGTTVRFVIPRSALFPSKVEA